MFCPKCGQRNEGNYKFCRGCGENLKAVAKAMERRWLKLLYRALDGYIRHRNRKWPKNARFFRRFRWPWLMFIGVYSASGLFGVKNVDKDWWLIASYLLLVLLAGIWDYVSYQRLSASGSSDNRSSAQHASLSDSDVELSWAPTTNELTIPTTKELAPPFSVAESTTRQLGPLTAAKKRSGELV